MQSLRSKLKILVPDPGKYQEVQIKSFLSFAPYYRILNEKILHSHDQFLEFYLKIIQKLVASPELLQPIQIRTDSSGGFSFEGIPVGHAYVITVSARKFTFPNPSRVITLQNNLTGFDFIASGSRIPFNKLVVARSSFSIDTRSVMSIAANP